MTKKKILDVLNFFWFYKTVEKSHGPKSSLVCDLCVLVSCVEDQVGFATEI
jgi:hypothetical protein